MTQFIDFQDLKARVSIEQVAEFLKLDVKRSANQLRGSCPTCRGGDRTLAITPAKQLWFCFTAQVGGDLISLAAHVRKCEMKEAAQRLAEHFTIPSTPPRSDRGNDSHEKLQPLPYLEHEHPAVEAIGFDPQIAETLGIGFSPKGLMKGLVAVPVRDAHGILHGYVGISEARLPKDFQPQSNVVPLRKPA